MAQASTIGSDEAKNVVTGRLEAATSGNATRQGPFYTHRDRYNLHVDCATGSFVGTYRVNRSMDAGQTWVPCTKLGTVLSFTASISEILESAEPAEALDIQVTAYTSGYLVYRFSHA
jgi:hypothetical protein